MARSKVLRGIVDNVALITGHETFRRWLKDQRVSPGDIVLINNSFIHRGKVKTVKSANHVALRADRTRKLEPVPLIAAGFSFTSDFKLISANAGNVPDLVALPDAVEGELNAIGELVFVLIGSVDESVRIAAPLGTAEYRELVLDPTLKPIVEPRGQSIHVRDTHDEEAVWNALVANVPGGIQGSLREKLGKALDDLEKEAYALVHLPNADEPNAADVLASIDIVLRVHAESFASAVLACKGEPDVNPEAFNQVLRIAYNFATDAVGLIRLVTSVCDLKPILLWSTIGYHYVLSERLKALPWQRSRRKPSLENYVHAIADARNATFHHLFPFKRSLEVRVPGEAIRQFSVRFLSDHRTKGGNRFDYEDKDLVDLLMGFTRSPERRLPARFWQLNVAIMEDTLELFRAIRRALYGIRGLMRQA